MTSRPTIDPAVAAALTDAAPARLVKKLDATPGLADTWTWSEHDDRWTIQTDKSETVTLTCTAGGVRAPDAVRCTCLLSPRCLHVLAVIATLAPAEAEADPAHDDEPTLRSEGGEHTSAGADAAGPPEHGGSGSKAPPSRRSSGDGSGAGGDAAGSADDRGGSGSKAPLSRRSSGASAGAGAGGDAAVSVEQRAAAGLAFAAGAKVLAAGADGAGAALQADLLRAVHACRSVGLHRAGSAGVRVVRGIRALRGDRAEFRLDDLAAALRELLAVSVRISDSSGGVARGLLGTARREYRGAGSLRLYGVFSEAIITATGYAGVVTYLVDGAGRLFSVSDVAPGPPERAAAAYEGGADIGDAVLSHRELSRAGLFVQGATASADGRLGSGAGVKAVRAAVSAWSDEAVAALWAPPLSEQLGRAGRAAELPLEDRPAGWDLVFFEADLLAATPDAILAAVTPAADAPAIPIRLIAASAYATSRARDNLRLLGRAGGLRVRGIGRLRLEAPRTLALLAVAPADAKLPAAWGGRVNVELDTLVGAHLAGRVASGSASASATATATVTTLSAAADIAGPSLDPLDPLRRRLQRAALGGRSTLPPEAARAIADEAARLERGMMPTAAALLRELAAAASTAERGLTGARRAVDPAVFARAWVRASAYEAAAMRELQRATWL